MSTHGYISLHLELPQTVNVVNCKVVEGLSKLTHAQLEIACEDTIELEGVLEQDAVIQLTQYEQPPRVWTLRVGHIDFARIDGGTYRYIFNLYPAVWLLRFTTDTRKFRNMSARDIISKVLNDHHVEHRFALLREPEKRKYCAQYRETNLDFIHRLLEWEGIYYYFEPNGEMVFADRSEDAVPTDIQSQFELVTGLGFNWDAMAVFELFKCRKVASGASTVSDFNWKKPAVKLLRSEQADEDGELEIYDFPVGYRREDQGAAIAKRRLEAYRVPSAFVEGKGNVSTFMPGRAFTFGAIANARFANDYLLTEVTHRFSNEHYVEQVIDMEGVKYQNEFSAIPKNVPFRPPLVTPHPHISGCHTAMVVGPEGEEIHTDTHGRYRAKFHWDREAVGTDEDSRWLRNTQEVATGMVLARMGWEQSIAYIDGDPDRPFGFARNINGQMVPEYGQPTNKTRFTIKTPTYPGGQGFNEMRMEDLSGAQHMDWHAEKDMFGEIGNDRSEHIGGDSSKKVGESYAWTVGNDQDIQIGGDFDCNVAGNYSLSVEGNRDKKVTGDEEVTITEVYAYNIEGNDKEEVTGDRKVKAAKEAGSITRQTKTAFERKVTSDVQVEGEGNLDIVVQDSLTEEVGAAKTVTVEDGSIGMTVGGICTMDVKANSTRESGDSMGYGAKNTKVVVNEDATFIGDEKINIHGERIILIAEQELSFKSAAMVLKLERGKATFKGKMKVSAGGNINVKGNKLNTTK